MEKKTHKRRRSGFTLAELLTVIAILVILVGLGVTGFLSLRRKMQIAKYDDLAREIYVAAQNHLTRLDANGMDKETEELLKKGTQLPYDNAPSDYTSADGAWDKNDYLYAVQRCDVMEALLPLGTVADDVRSNGFYVIEYNIKTGTVYSVFYAGESIAYETVAAVEDFRKSRNIRMTYMVGYYGGSAVVRDELVPCPTPKLQIINNNELRLNILNVPTEEGLTVQVEISDGSESVQVLEGQHPGYIAIDGANRTVLMDSILEPDAHFHELFKDLIPGKDLTITVTYSKPGCLSSSATITANSLFASRVEGSDGTAAVTLACARHLQNLENTVSYLDDDTIVRARQTEHIQWNKDQFGEFVSIQNKNANEKLLRFEGSNLEIRDIHGRNGLFAVTKENMQLSGIHLVNPQITAEEIGTGPAGDPVGGLVGTAGKGTSIAGCGVYYRKLSGSFVDYNAYIASGVDGKSNVTGGLVGSADSITVTNSFAALPYLKGGGNPGGTLIGSATKCYISNSYANCDDLHSTFNSFIGTGGGSTVSHCYAVANVQGDSMTPFAPDSNTISDSYYAVSHRDYSENPPKDRIATQFCYYQNGWVTTDQKGMAKSTESDGWAKNWANMIAPSSHPYRESLDGRAFPYPAIAELDHYGSWPEGDGTVDLKITMALLNNKKAGYAIFAGHVVVKETIEDDEGNTTEKTIFDSKDHITKEGKFDGKDTVSVVPGTEITILIDKVEDGYEYVNTTFPDHTGNTTKVNYTVKKDTEAVINFQQRTFRLRGMQAVNDDENVITDARYSIDLTSPKKTLNITDQNLTEPKVETGSMVTVRPKISGAYFASVAWYTPEGQNEENDRVYLTQGEDGFYSFPMPAYNTDVHVKYTTEEVRFQIKYYLMDTEGEYSTEPTQVVNPYKFGLGVQVNQGMIQSMADSSGLPVTLDGEHVRYLESAIVTGKDNQKLFECKMDEDGVVTEPGTPYTTKEGDLGPNENYIVHIYIARKKYRVTLTAMEHINGVRFGAAGDYVNTVSDEFFYGAEVTASTQVAPGYGFSYWDPQTSRFLMSGETDYTFKVPAFDLHLQAVAAMNQHLVTINLEENDESWLYSSESRQSDPITLTLVNSLDDTKVYPMKVLTDDNVSYAMQAVVPAVEEYEQGYYVRVNYASGRESWIYESGAEDGTDETNQRVLLYVRDREVEKTAKFYTITYFPNKKNVSGTVPKGGTFPVYYHVTVQGNTGLLRNLTDDDKIFSGWKDHYATGTGNEHTYTGGETLMLTRRTDMFAQWVQSLSVTYHAGESDGGELPVDRNEYVPGDPVIIRRGSLTRKGYRFLGWSMTENAASPDFTEDGVTYVLQSVPLNLYPVWALEDYTIRFYNANGTALEGEGYIFTGRHYGDTIVAPDVTEGTNSTILGWSLTRGGDVAYQPGASITVTGNQTFYACPVIEPVQVTFKSGDNSVEYGAESFGKGIPGYLNCVPTVDGSPAPVTAWSTEPNGKGVLHFCRDDGRSQEAIAFTEDTTLYAVTGKVYNFNKQLWFDTLGAAVRYRDTVSGDTLIVYRDTLEPHNIQFNKDLYVIASGNRSVTWKTGATVYQENGGGVKLTDEIPTDAKDASKEFVGCMSVYNNGAAVALTFGRSDVPTLSMEGGSLTFNANEQSRVVSLRQGATFHMYDGITLTNGYRPKMLTGQNGNTRPGKRSVYGGGVYAGAGAVFYMHGGTISYCEAVSGGGVYLFTGSRMYMGDMVQPTAYSSTATYYTIKHDDTLKEDIFINTDGVTQENYKKFYVTAGDPKICYNHASQDWDSTFGDGGGGLLSFDLKNGDLILYRGSITNNTTTANGGGIVTDSGSPNDFLRIYEVDISHNTADHLGGGILQWQGTVYVYNSTIRQNKAQYGGGIYLKNGGTTFNIEFYFGDISDNEATEQGGGVYAVSWAKFYVRGGNLCRNTAKEGGGAYLAGGGSHLSFEKGAISDNTAQGNGGGVYSGGTVDMSGGTLSGNQAGNYGGGIYVGGTMNMSDGTICDNDSRYLGGGIMLGGRMNLSGGSLYGNTDTDYQRNRADEDNVNPGPNDIYLMGDQIITIPEGGIDLSGEERVAVDCERDDSLRFRGKDQNHRPPYRFAVYDNPGADFEEKDASFFTYHGTRSTTYSIETLNSPNLTVMSHLDLRNQTPPVNRPVGLYFANEAGDGVSSFVSFDFNYPGCINPERQTRAVGEVLELNDSSVVQVPPRPGYYIAGWARTPDALEEQYELYYDVVKNVWRSKYQAGAWTEEQLEPKYTVQNLYSQTLYAMWRPWVVVYDLGAAAGREDVTIQPTSIGPSATLLNPDPPKFTVEQADGEKKEFIFKHWVDKDGTVYNPTQQVDLTENLRLTAIWEERPAGTVQVTLDPNGGAFMQSGQVFWKITVTKGGNIEKLPGEGDITAARKKLIGWDSDRNTQNPQYSPEGAVNSVDADMTLYAIWMDMYDVTYDYSGGAGSGSVSSVMQGDSITVTDTLPDKPGNEFLGWSEDENATEATYRAGDRFGPITSNRTLYAVWRRQGYYQVTFHGNGGAWGTAETWTVEANDANDANTPQTLPTWANHRLLGWAKSDMATKAEYSPTDTIRNLDQHTTYYAVWAPTVTITFAFNRAAWQGAENKLSVEVIKGADYTIPEDKPERQGYSFVCWQYNNRNTYDPGDTIEGSVLSGNITLTAQMNKVRGGNPLENEKTEGGEESSAEVLATQPPVLETTPSAEETQPTETTASAAETQPTQTTAPAAETQPTQTTASAAETQPTQTTAPAEETQPTETTVSAEETAPAQTTPPETAEPTQAPTEAAFSPTEGEEACAAAMDPDVGTWEITFLTDGGEWKAPARLSDRELEDPLWDEEENSLTYAAAVGEDVTVLPPELEREGYILDGWLRMEEEEAEAAEPEIYPAGQEIPLTASMKLRPIWKKAELPGIIIHFSVAK